MAEIGNTWIQSSWVGLGVWDSNAWRKGSWISHPIWQGRKGSWVWKDNTWSYGTWQKMRVREQKPWLASAWWHPSWEEYSWWVYRWTADAWGSMGWGEDGWRYQTWADIPYGRELQRRVFDDDTLLWISAITPVIDRASKTYKN